jgi:ribosome-associated protein
MTTPNSSNFLHELIFKSSRSGGPGGQNVNKVNSKVTLTWDITNSRILSGEQKVLLLKKLLPNLTNKGVLILSAQDKRSQLQNKETVLNKLDKLLQKAFTLRKVRKATKPNKAALRKRIQEKKHKSERKQLRKKLW